MKLRIGGRTHEVVSRGPGIHEVDGASVSLAITRAPGDVPGRFDVASGARRRALRIARSGDRVFAQVGDRVYTLTVLKRAAAAADAAIEGGLEAPMPGRVTRIGVKVGDRVTRGQELLVIEAMKMENALTAPRDGRVTALRAVVGDMVTPGEPLVVVEEAGE